MPLTRQKKEELAESYKGLAESPHLFLVDYKGISVPDVTELRSKIRESGGHYVVVKNRLVLRAIQETAAAGLADQFTGPTAVAYGADDPVGLAKALTEFAKTVPAIEFKAGLVDSQVVSAEQVEEIAKMPSREDLLAKLLFLLQSPITRFVRTLAAAGPQQMASVLHQVAAEKE